MINRKLILGLVLVGILMAVFVYAATLREEREVATCSDGDGGLNFSIKSGITGQNLNETNYTRIDYCYNNNVLVEFTCDNTGNSTYAQAWSQGCGQFNQSCINGTCA